MSSNLVLVEASFEELKETDHFVSIGGLISTEYPLQQKISESQYVDLAGPLRGQVTTLTDPLDRQIKRVLKVVWVAPN